MTENEIKIMEAAQRINLAAQTIKSEVSSIRANQESLAQKVSTLTEQAQSGEAYVTEDLSQELSAIDESINHLEKVVGLLPTLSANPSGAANEPTSLAGETGVPYTVADDEGNILEGSTPEGEPFNNQPQPGATLVEEPGKTEDSGPVLDTEHTETENEEIQESGEAYTLAEAEEGTTMPEDFHGGTLINPDDITNSPGEVTEIDAEIREDVPNTPEVGTEEESLFPNVTNEPTPTSSEGTVNQDFTGDEPNRF